MARKSKGDVFIDFDLEELARDIEKEVAQAVKEQNQEIARAIETMTQSWKTKLELEVDEDDEGATISTDDMRYQWVDEGTKPHQIRPANARRLRWLPGDKVRGEIARRKTAQAARDVAVFTTVVNHPGIRPRSFTERAMAGREMKVYDAIDLAIEKAIG